LTGAGAILLAGIACCASAAGQEQKNPTADCGGEIVARGTAARILDGRTFVLDDAREIRLAGIEVPAAPPPSSQNAGLAPGGAAAMAALDALVGGDEVVLRRAEAPADRYGRVLAYAYAVRDGDELFAQGEMVASGFARVGAGVGKRACATELLSRETAARAAKLGLWANPYYDILSAETPADVLARRGRFALVEGKVVSVRESGATLYVNFGRHWSEDFTVTIPKRNERNFTAAGLDLQKLAGRRVRVRDWVEERGAGGSPWIEAEHPEQIEMAGRE
jgi:endonuclease YncB( thermonuclease family)